VLSKIDGEYFYLQDHEGIAKVAREDVIGLTWNDLTKTMCMAIQDRHLDIAEIAQLLNSKKE
jgi:hypothetical protein